MNFDLSSFIDKKTLVGTALGAGIVWFGEFVKSRFNKKQNAHYLAVRLTPILEQFLDRCYDVAFDDGTYAGQPAGGDGTYKEQTKNPELQLPDDVDWKSINKKLLEEIMALPTETYSIYKNLIFEWEFQAVGDNSEYIFARQLAFSKLAISIDAILSKVKKIIKQKPTHYEHYSPREKCSNFIREHEERMQKALEGNK